VKISAKTEYACIAMLELSERYGTGEPVRIRTIADEHGVPSRFLVQILLQLKGAGFVASTRGASGGYQLVKPPEQISLGEVMNVIEGADEPITSSASPESRSARLLRVTWQQVADVERQALHAITFADLVERARRTTENMYYI
jgi:Rrf2 family protein